MTKCGLIESHGESVAQYWMILETTKVTKNHA